MNMERQARSSPWALVELGKGIPVFLSSMGASSKKNKGNTFTQSTYDYLAITYGNNPDIFRTF